MNSASLVSPSTVSADGENLILSFSAFGTVQIWNPARQEVLSEYTDFAVAMNAIRFQDDLAVAELFTGNVVRASDRSILGSGLQVPAGLAAKQDSLWVSDWATRIVWPIVQGGVPLANPIPLATGLSIPEGLALDPAGHLLVVESGARLLAN